MEVSHSSTANGAPTPTVSTTLAKDRSLEGLRGIASLVVVLTHSLCIFFPYLSSNIHPDPAAVPKTVVDALLIYPPFSLLYSGEGAVFVFFVLSGYVLTLKFDRSHQPGVFETAAPRRYIRLGLPACASAMFAWTLLSLGLMGNKMAASLGLANWAGGYYPSPISFGSALVEGFIGAPLFGDVRLNGPLWTLQVELIGSILLFACFALFARRSSFFLCAWFLFFAIVLSGHGAGTIYYAALLAGSQLHKVTPWLKRNPRISSAMALVGLALIQVNKSRWFSALVGLHLPDLTPFGPDLSGSPLLFWRCVSATLLVAGVIGSVGFARCLSMRVPAYLGRISFALYLLHMPLAMSLLFWTMKWAVSMRLGFLSSVGISMVVYLACSILLAELFTRLVDQPSIRLANRLFRNTPEQAVVPVLPPETIGVA